MGRLMKLVIELWSKNSTGEWSFEETSCYTGEAIIINNNQSFDGLIELMRIRLNLGILTPVALTYQLPDWMLVPDGPRTPPITLSCDKDVEILASVRDYMSEAMLYVTSGPELVARYHFFRRSPFSIGDTTYLEEDVTEAQHRQAVLEMVYGTADDNGEAEDPAKAGTISPEEHIYFDPNDEANNYRGAAICTTNGQDASLVNQSTSLEVEPINVWRDMMQDEEYWDGIAPDENNYEVYYTQSPHQTQGAIGLPLAPNRRIHVPQPATIIIIDDDDGSTTGSQQHSVRPSNSRFVNNC
ncbi:hypothetical protein IGI04_019605 [Brassica rapa subsp. trilocularis]|uniref:Aminotransferase-like plant mobile domain-containing protein n=1 Tax=Brassica rapa subsp. trilocularis TaxID=1813537 RepID=A0ABQ7MJQ8_BRACM|nr:hypothetical protein IGI04_019605 [Brassica rapa subsp. trilocularis]